MKTSTGATPDLRRARELLEWVLFGGPDPWASDGPEADVCGAHAGAPNCGEGGSGCSCSVGVSAQQDDPVAGGGTTVETQAGPQYDATPSQVHELLSWVAKGGPEPPSRGTQVDVAPEPLIASPLTAAEVRDERIDVFAQRTLMRLSKAPTASVAARGMLAAVKDGTLAGIYKEDERVPALRAKRMGTWWGKIIPSGSDAVVLLDPRSPLAGAPIIVFRNAARAHVPRMDGALLTAWDSVEALWRAKHDPNVAVDRCVPPSAPLTAGSESSSARSPATTVPAVCTSLTTTIEGAFGRWWDALEPIEGSYRQWLANQTNVLYDRGGATNYGITYTTFKARHGAAGLDSDFEAFRKMTRQQARLIARSLWGYWRVDLIQNPSIAVMVADLYWGAVPKRILNDALTSVGLAAAQPEARLTDETLAVLNTAPPLEFVGALDRLVYEHMGRQGRFARGLQNRAIRIWGLAMTILGRCDLVAHWLNGRPRKVITDQLAWMSREEVTLLHEAAVHTPSLGNRSLIALMTRR